MTLEVRITRTGLSLADLVIGDHIDDGPFWVPHDGIAEPDFSFRLTYAPDSIWTGGKRLLAAVLDASSIPLTVMVTATSAADLTARKAELAAAFGQFAYDVTITVDGQAQTWAADPCRPQWGSLSHAMSSQFMARATLAIPVNP